MRLRFDGFPPTDRHKAPGEAAYVDGIGFWEVGVEREVLDDQALFLLATHTFSEVKPPKQEKKPAAPAEPKPAEVKETA